MIQAILFDLDNTLTHRDQSVEAYSYYLAQYYQRHLGEVDVMQIKAIINRIDNGGYPKKELLTHPSIAASVAQALQHELKWHHAVDFDELTAFWFEQFGLHAVPMEGSEQVLQELKQQGFKLAIVSNGGHDTRLKIIEGLNIAHYFDLIVSSELAGSKKPEPEIFQYVCQQLNVMPEECLFIGDHPINDIQGARNAGMHPVWMEGFHEVDPYDAQLISPRIKKLEEIWQFIG